MEQDAKYKIEIIYSNDPSEHAVIARVNIVGSTDEIFVGGRTISAVLGKVAAWIKVRE